ncbi:MAG: SAM-dependent methyltransferase [Anaerolineae bacterium]
MEIDLTKPNPARIVDYYLGGHHNFEIDRLLADRAAEMYPGDVIEETRKVRLCLQRAVTYMAKEKGLTHFLDFGSGLPTCGNTHEVVLAINPQARVIYSDIDHLTVAYGKEIIAQEPHVRYVWCDAADPSTLLDSPEAKELLGDERRVGIIFMALAHFLTDETLASGARRLYEWAAPGSHLFLTVESETWQTDPYLQEVSKLVHRAGIPLYQRAKQELLALLSPWRLTEHGVARNLQWGLSEEEKDPEERLTTYSMVLYK